ncbi:MAG: rRNA pseudouridine synthase [Oscillospiraceae bacterium]|jgi:23S rRNA pseudouridine2605 synthase|nr:rRNA pseudouridine synthase [Oscillospiraceae bacterium]
MTNSNSERIQKILSAHGASSRRKAEQLILEGRVTVNGVVAKLGESAEDGVDEIAIDGIPLDPIGHLVYIMLNKPRGYITTMSDERGRDTVTQLVGYNGARVYPVGRLDMDSEGLLLLTNDGHFANAVMHPSHNRAKTYEVRVRGDVNSGAKLLRQPITVDSHIVQAASVEVNERTAAGGVLLISINEGRNRQIRKMCEQCGLNAVQLKRISIGTLELGSLKPGQWRHLTDEEVAAVAGS